MRIKDTRNTNQPRLGTGIPRLGKLKKGAEKSASGFGADLDYFRVAFELPYSADENNLTIWKTLYGDKPTEFPNVFLLGRSADEVFSSAYEEYGAGQLLKTRCDGETIQRSYNQQTARHEDKPIPCRCDPDKRTCQRIGRLNFMPFDFIRATGLFGYFTLETHSLYDVLELGSIVDEIFAQRGTVTGIPFVLGRSPQEKSARYLDKSGQPKRTRKVMNLVYLYPSREFVAERLLTSFTTDAPALTTGQARALPAPVTTPPTTAVSELRWNAERLTKLDTWARQGLGLSADELLAELNAESWEQFADHTAVIAAVRAKGLRVVVREIGFTPDKQIDLLTPLGAVRLDFDVDQLLDLLKTDRDRFTAVHKPETWTPGKKYPIEPHWLKWIDQAGRIEPKRLQPLEAEVAEYEEVDNDE